MLRRPLLALRRIFLPRCSLHRTRAWTATAVLGSALQVMTSPGLVACTGKDESKGTPSGQGSGAPEDPARPSAPKSAADLFAAHSAAAGGADKLAAVKTAYFEADIEESKSKLNGSMRTWWAGDKFYLVQSLPGIGQVSAGSDGKVIWTDDPIHELRLVEGMEAEQYRWSSAPLASDVYLKLFPSFGEVTTATVDGQEVYQVIGTSQLGDKVTFFFSVQSRLMVGQKFAQASLTGDIPVQTTLSDYRDVQGLKIAHRMVAHTPVADIVQTLRKVELNPAVDDTRFVLPIALQRVAASPTQQPPAPVKPAGKKGQKPGAATKN